MVYTFLWFFIFLQRWFRELEFLLRRRQDMIYGWNFLVLFLVIWKWFLFWIENRFLMDLNAWFLQVALVLIWAFHLLRDIHWKLIWYLRRARGNCLGNQNVWLTKIFFTCHFLPGFLSLWLECSIKLLLNTVIFNIE